MIIQVFSMEIDMLSNEWSNIEETMIVVISILIFKALILIIKSSNKILCKN
jgi:hypothetical protein